MSTPTEAEFLASLLAPHIHPTRQMSPAIPQAAMQLVRDGLMHIAERERAARQILRDVSHVLQTRAAERRNLSPEGCAALAADIDRAMWSGPETAPGADVIALPVRQRATMGDVLRDVTGRGPEGVA